MTLTVRMAGFLLFSLIAVDAASGDVVVIANKTSKSANLELIEERQPAKLFKLHAGSSRALRINNRAVVRLLSIKADDHHSYSAQGQPASDAGMEAFRVEGGSAYFLYEKPEGIVGFRKIGLLNDAVDPVRPKPVVIPPPTPRAGHEETAPAPPSVYRVSVKILVDDDERAARRAWEVRLRSRLREASKLFERQFGVRFEVAAVGTWTTSNSLDDFIATLGEFEHRVSPEPAQVAIGFTSQYQAPDGTTNVGGTRIPLGSHILVREWSQHFSERERYELLVHELGHYLGAVHSPEADSVMRPLLGDRKALAKSFIVGFDPLNALAVGIVAEHLSRNKVARLMDLPATKTERLAAIYSTLYQAMPDDRAAPQLLALVGGGGQVRLHHPPDAAVANRPTPDLSAPPGRQEELAQHEEPEAEQKEPFVLATRQVLFAIVEAARQNAELNGSSDVAEGDELTQIYVRAAAAEALKLPAARRVRSFLWGLAIGLERHEEIRRYAVLGDLIRQIESDGERRLRLKVLGRPTWRGREDLSQHFTFSAAIVSTAGKRAAEAAGMAKELRDARSGSGFSFADWAADLAGIALAERLKAGEIRLEELARGFTTADYLPDVTGLKEGLSWERFQQTYGSTTDRRFRAVDAEIRRNIERLGVFHGR